VDNGIATLYHATAPHYPELRGQVAIVTGAAQGIGQGIAVRLAREEMQVVVADKDFEKMASTVSSLRQLGATVLGFHGDLSQSNAIQKLFEQTIETFHGIHLLVNNAADIQRKRLLDEHEALLDHQLANNIRGPYLCSCQAAKWMQSNGGGNIIHISSVGALRAHEIGLPYDATKGAINAMTRAMAIDLSEYNIRVNAIAPGVTHTYRWPAADHPSNHAFLGRIPLRRFGTVVDIGAMVAFLASPEASYITGQILYVDGGITAQLSPPGYTL
jgi:NAD(P)-dependent dehydrogenase (short-subunit alcohol dehydrogenase family)